MNLPIIKQGLKTYSPMILSGLGIVGVGTTTYLAVRNANEARDHLEENYLDFTRLSATELQKFKLTWKFYLPTAISAASTILMITGSTWASMRRSAAVAALYSLTENAFREYQHHVINEVGRGKEEKIREKIAEERLTKRPVDSSPIFITGGEDVLYYDKPSDRYFRGRKIEDVRRIVNDINERLISEMSIELNHLYIELGLAPTEYGIEAGWTVDDMLHMNYTTMIAETGEPCIVLDYRFASSVMFKGHR